MAPETGSSGEPNYGQSGLFQSVLYRADSMWQQRNLLQDVAVGTDPTEATAFIIRKPCSCRLIVSVSARLPMEDQVRRRAYQLWEADGCPQGQDQHYWFKALAEVAASAATTITPPPKRAPRVKKAA